MTEGRQPCRKDEDRTLKDRELYEELRDEGASKEKAARISNAAARGRALAVGRAAEAGDYDDWTVDRAAQAREGTRHHRVLGQAQGGTHLDAAQPLRWRASSSRVDAATVRGSTGSARRAPPHARVPLHRCEGQVRAGGDVARARALVIPPAWEQVWISVRARWPHPGGRHRPEGPQAVPLPPGLGGAARQGQVRAGAAARRCPAPRPCPGDGRPEERGRSRATGCWPRPSGCSTRRLLASGRRAICRPTAAGASRPCAEGTPRSRARW